jgi:ABC-type bacteriocin/lantibiotic exporter with double-glycine peptidase domain
MAMTIFGLVPPYVTKLLVDEVYVSRDHLLLVAILGASFVLTMTSAVVGAIRNYYSQVVAGQMANAMHLMFIEHLLHLPVRFHEQRRVGEMLARVGDAQSALGTVGRVFSTLIGSGLQILVVPPVLLLINWRLTMLSLVAMPLVTVLSLAAGRVLRNLSRQQAEAHAELSSFQLEALTNIRTLKLLTAEAATTDQLKSALSKAFRLQLHAGVLSGTVNVLRAFLHGGATALFMFFGWRAILKGELTLGGFLAFTAYLRYFTAPVSSMAGLLTDLQRASVSLARTFEYLDEPLEALTTNAARLDAATASLRGHFDLRHVSYRYANGKPALTDVSTQILPGAFTAVVGESGSGKSTLLRLLSRIDQPMHGQILVDRIDLASLGSREYRRHLAVVWQETGLFAGTLRHNLLIGAPQGNHHLLDMALAITRLDSLVSDLPDGLESPVAEWGTSLSSGQRQRLVLARAIVRNAQIMILDEPTSHVDVVTESVILKDLLDLWRGRTVILVTHRLPTVSCADNIILLASGRLEACGTHAMLYQQSTTYRQLLQAEDRPAPTRTGLRAVTT